MLKKIVPFSLLRYFLYHYKAKTKYHIHSPFIYDLITKGFENNSVSYNKAYINDSHKKDGKGISKQKINTFLKTLNYFKPKKTLIIGNPNDLILYILNINSTEKTVQIENVNQIKNLIIPNVENERFDLIYVQNYTYLQNQDYFQQILKLTHNDSFFIFDHIHLDKNKHKIWQYIYQHDKTTATVDLYYIGLVFLRKESTPQHFILKF